MAKLTLADVASGHGSTATLNSNAALIEAALENTLSRDGTSPNQMNASLDMNSQRVINLPAAISGHEPATYAQVLALVNALTTEGVETVDASLVNYTHGGTGGVQRSLLQVLTRIVVVEDFGAVGDGSTDDTTAIINAAAAASNGVLYFTYGKTYKVTSQITCQGEWNLNGATIHLVLDGNERGIEMDDNSWIHNGIIKKTGTGTYTSGEYQSHVKIGLFDSLTGKENVRVSDLVLETAGTTTNHTGVYVAGDSHNFVIENITARSSSTLGRVVGCHWGNTGDFASTGSTHPHNGVIRNIYAEAMTLNNVQQSVVSLSGSYNILVENVFCERSAYGFIADYAGDRGFRYASANEQSLAQKGNVFRNCVCLQLDDNGGQGVQIQGQPTLETTYVTYPNTVVDSVSVACASSSTTTNGIEITYAGKVKVLNCRASKFSSGAVVGRQTFGALISGGEFFSNSSYGISVSDNTVNPEDTIVEDNYCYENGTAGIRTSASYRTTIRDNELGNRSGTDSTQNYGIEIGTADRGHEIVNNQFHAYAVAGILTATSAGQFVDVFNGNTFDDLTAPIVGQDFIPYAKVPTPDGTTILWHGVGNATPEAAVTAPPGSTCTNTANGKHYTKETGTGNTGWVVTGTQT